MDYKLVSQKYLEKLNIFSGGNPVDIYKSLAVDLPPDPNTIDPSIYDIYGDVQYRQLYKPIIREQPKIVNLFVVEDFEIYDDQGAGYSDDIWPIISRYYDFYGKKVSIIGRKDSSNLFNIIPFNIGYNTEPILGKGTYTAVYMIKDKNIKIHENINNKYILRIYTRDNNYKEKNMFEYDKVKDEFKMFKQYMAIIYYYGSIYEPSCKYPLYKDGPFDYNITKIYNTLSVKKPIQLDNKQKVQFLLQNIRMLKYLAYNKYIHCDYKLDNVAYDDNEIMNVILIDYDITTLQPLVKSNPKFTSDTNGNIIGLYSSSTYPPRYISEDLPPAYPVAVKYRLPLNKWDKYSIGGLVNIILSIKIQYKFDILGIDPKLSMGKITKLNSKNIPYSLNLYDTSYDNIPTYQELENIFTYLRDKNYV
jgi:serine/threonine protein kinase